MSIFLLTKAIDSGSANASEDPWYWLSAVTFSQLFSPNSNDSGVIYNVDAVYLHGFTFDMLSAVLLSNVPQLLLTICYYFYNSVLTSMLSAFEYDSYGVSPKALRVSRPVDGSQQRCTNWLSIPYRYGVPMLILFSVLNWLASQALYYLRMVVYLPNGQDTSLQVSELGYSRFSIFLSIIIGTFMILLLVGLSFRRLKSSIPLAGSCSVAISAACHLSKDEELETAALGLVQWGETLPSPSSQEEEISQFHAEKGHCSFTSLETRSPTLTKLYA